MIENNAEIHAFWPFLGDFWVILDTCGQLPINLLSSGQLPLSDGQLLLESGQLLLSIGQLIYVTC
jgi:hypothetical protein